MPDQSFKKASTLPPYIFGEINSLKQKARHAGEDIIDFGMGNPDRETPKPIVDKLIETVQNPATHRYSQSIGLPKLRLAMSDWYLRKYNVSLDHENEMVAIWLHPKELPARIFKNKDESIKYYGYNLINEMWSGAKRFMSNSEQ